MFLRHFDELTVAVFAFVYFISLMSSQGKVRCRKNILIWLIIMLAFGAASSLYNHVPVNIWTEQMLLTSKAFLFLFLIYAMSPNERDLIRTGRFFLFLAVVILLLGFVDAATYPRLRHILHYSTAMARQGPLHPVQSIFGHPGVFGWFMAYISCFLIAHLLIYRKKGPFLFLSIIFLVGVVISMKRKSLVALSVAVLSALMFGKTKKREKLFVISSVLGFGFLFVVFFWNRLMFLVHDTLTHYITFEAIHGVDYYGPRITFYLTGFDIAKKFFPFGAGFGRFGSWLSRVHYSPLYYQYGFNEHMGLSPQDPRFLNDNFWPMILGETGVWGCLALIVVFILCLIRLIKIARSETLPNYSIVFALGSFMVLVEALLESMATPIFINSPQSFFVLGAVGISLSLQRVNRRKSNKREYRGEPSRFVTSPPS